MTIDVAKSVRKMFVDGKWVESESMQTFDAVSPATGETIGDIAALDVDTAVAAAEAAFPGCAGRCASARPCNTAWSASIPG